ncbi:unnamed protein product, partial [Protopolystoma xenopodis]
KESNEELINVIGRREHEHKVSCEPLQQPVIGQLNDENSHLNVTHQQSQQSALFSPPHARHTNLNLRCAEGAWPQLSSKGHSRRISSQRQIYLLGPSPKHLYYPIRLASDLGSNEESINTEAEICHAVEAGLVDGSVGSLDNESKWEEYKSKMDGHIERRSNSIKEKQVIEITDSGGSHELLEAKSSELENKNIIDKIENKESDKDGIGPSLIIQTSVSGRPNATVLASLGGLVKVRHNGFPVEANHKEKKR